METVEHTPSLWRIYNWVLITNLPFHCFLCHQTQVWKTDKKIIQPERQMDAEKKRLSLTEDERDEEEGDKHLSPPFHFSWEVGGIA